ncbi:hypothetical protein ACRAWD_02625 [Caulobacter segnis]
MGANGLVSRMMRERRGLVLPLWHNVGPDEVGHYSAPLSDIRALVSTAGIPRLCTDIVKVLRPKESPLNIAKAELARFGWSAPPISDEWWLDMVEGQADLSWPMGQGPWLFPLPQRANHGDQARGLSIAWTAMQLDWKAEADDLKIGQTTRPEQVHAFIDENPALKEMCEQHPNLVANYAPQLLILEFSGPFSGAFDEPPGRVPKPRSPAFRISGIPRPPARSSSRFDGPTSAGTLATMSPTNGSMDGEATIAPSSFPTSTTSSGSYPRIAPGCPSGSGKR